MITHSTFGGMGDPLVYMTHRLIFHIFPWIWQKKINTNRLEPRTARPNWVGHVEGKDISEQATARFAETRTPWIPLWKIKKRYKEKKGTHTPKKLWNSPAMRRRCTSWSNFLAMGWSHGNVLAQALNSSCVHRRNKARNNSWPMGRWCRIFNISINMAMGTENNTIDWSELTILYQQHWSNWNELTRSAQRDLETPWEELIGGETSRGGV